MAASLLLGCVPLLAQDAPRQGTTPATVTFAFSNPALQPARYSLVIREDGTGHYHSEPGSAPVQDGSVAQPFDRDITLGGPIRAQLFALARKDHFFARECDSKRSNLAFTGTKTLTYAGPEGAGSCSFNHGREAQLDQAANSLIAVATTLEEGRKLALLLQHDRLGLDAEVELLAGEEAGGRALALENIAPVLHAIANSDEVMHHTRSRAEALLGQ